MSWLGILGRATWDVVGHPTEANPGEDKWVAEHLYHQQQQQEQQHTQHVDHVHHDNVGHDPGQVDSGTTGGW